MKKWIFAFLFAVFIFLFIVLLSWILKTMLRPISVSAFFARVFLY